MFRLHKVVKSGSSLSIRRFSEAASKPEATPAPASGGSTFLQRFSSFLAGCGVGFGLSYYFIYEELVNSNENLLRNIKKIDGYKGN